MSNSKTLLEHLSDMMDGSYSSSSVRYTPGSKDSSTFKDKDEVSFEKFVEILNRTNQDIGRLEEKIGKVAQKCEELEAENKSLKNSMAEKKTFYKTSIVFYKIVAFVFCGTVAGLLIVYLFFISETLLPSLAEPTVLNGIVKIAGIFSPLGLSVWLWNVFFKNEIIALSKDINKK